MASSRLETKLLGVLAASFVAGILFWHSWPLYPFKLLVVLMHESGHAAAALLTGGAVRLVARFGPSLLRRGLLVFLGTFGVSYALYDIRDDLLHFGSAAAQSDADALAHATLVPAIVWGIAWGLVSIGLVALTLRFVLSGRAPWSRAAPAFPKRSAA